MKKIIQCFIQWFKDHWPKSSFKIFIVFALTVMYLEIFHHADFVQFVQFILLVAFKDLFTVLFVALRDLVTKLAQNDAIVTALGAAIVGGLGALFHKNDKK